MFSRTEMESPSAKVPILFQNKKLKQATLPFEIIKIKPDQDPLPLKGQQLDCYNVETKEDDKNIIELRNKKNNCVSDVTNTSESGSLEEVIPQTSCDLQMSVDDMESKCLEAEKQNQNYRDKVADLDDVVIDSVKEEPKSESANVEEVNSLNQKRRLEDCDKSLEPQSRKRAKLILNVDKITKCGVELNQSLVKVDCETENRELQNCIDSKELKNLGLHTDLAERVIDSTNKNNLEDTGYLPLTAEPEEQMPLLESKNEKISKRSKCTNENGNPLQEKRHVKTLTPKRLEQRAELAKKREELLQEREKTRKERIEKKERLRKEKIELKRKLREEREKKRQVELELKNEERRKRQEHRIEVKRKKEEQKLEEKRKKEEEALQKMKQHTREAEVFSSFFKKCDIKSQDMRDENESPSHVVFMPFTVKGDMRLAPINRNPMADERRKKFEEHCSAQCHEMTYLDELRSGVFVPRKSENTWPLEEKYEEVIVLDEGLDFKDQTVTFPKRFDNGHPKLLQFHENRRPPYWGTWRKKSKTIRPRNPFGKDEIFDYEIDSDDEWEEEEPGESLHGSDDEKESEDEYEVDNEFFVPHGYLSEDENPEEEIISPDTQKAKLKLLVEKFDQERNEKTKLLKPITLGCIWFNNDAEASGTVNPSVVRFLNKRTAVPWTDDVPIVVLQDENTDPNETTMSDGGTPTTTKIQGFPESAVPDLISLVHGSTNSRKNLAKIFLLQWKKREENKIIEGKGNINMLSQTRVSKKIKELANWEICPEEGPYYGKFCWYVKKKVREMFGLADLMSNEKDEENNDGKQSESVKKISPLITKFTKILTEEERKSQVNFNVRKCLPIAETTPTISNIVMMKCTGKLKAFCADPSLNSKYNLGISEITDNDATVQVDREEVSKNTLEGESSMVSKYIDDNVNAEKSCEDTESTVLISNTVEGESVHSVEDQIDSSDVALLTKQTSTISASNTENDTVNIVHDGVNGSGNTDQKCLNGEELKPAVKKRVPILFSAPRGCEIVKSDVLPKKPAMSLDDVVKKYETSENMLKE